MNDYELRLKFLDSLIDEARLDIKMLELYPADISTQHTAAEIEYLKWRIKMLDSVCEDVARLQDLDS